LLNNVRTYSFIAKTQFWWNFVLRKLSWIKLSFMDKVFFVKMSEKETAPASSSSCSDIRVSLEWLGQGTLTEGEGSVQLTSLYQLVYIGCS
jgi:hypothetical protein